MKTKAVNIKEVLRLLQAGAIPTFGELSSEIGSTLLTFDKVDDEQVAIMRMVRRIMEEVIEPQAAVSLLKAILIAVQTEKSYEYFFGAVKNVQSQGNFNRDPRRPAFTWAMLIAVLEAFDYITSPINEHGTQTKKCVVTLFKGWTQFITASLIAKGVPEMPGVCSGRISNIAAKLAKACQAKAFLEVLKRTESSKDYEWEKWPQLFDGKDLETTAEFAVLRALGEQTFKAKSVAGQIACLITG